MRLFAHGMAKAVAEALPTTADIQACVDAGADRYERAGRAWRALVWAGAFCKADPVDDNPWAPLLRTSLDLWRVARDQVPELRPEEAERRAWHRAQRLQAMDVVLEAHRKANEHLAEGRPLHALAALEGGSIAARMIRAEPPPWTRGEPVLVVRR